MLPINTSVIVIVTRGVPDTACGLIFTSHCLKGILIAARAIYGHAVGRLRESFPCFHTTVRSEYFHFHFYAFRLIFRLQSIDLVMQVYITKTP